jgi:uncharacterized protein
MKNILKVFECITGSKLYGTNTPISDTDIRGIFIQSPYSYNLIQETITEKETDTSFYALRKFMYLCSQNNPNIIEMLFVPDDLIISQTTNIWKTIIKNRHLFPAKKAANRFIGYAKQQLKRIKTHRSWLLNPPKKIPMRSDFGLHTNKVVSADQIGAFNVIMKQYLEEIYEFHDLKNIIEEHMGEPDFLGIVQSIGHNMDINTIAALTGFHPNFITIVQKEKNYQNAMNHWHQYCKWKKERNPERAKLEKQYGYDCKHAQHIVRLITEGVELLQTGHITFPRPDAKWLLEIKNGCYTYNELMNLVNEEKIKEVVNDAKEKSNLQEESNQNLIVDLFQECMSIYTHFTY